MSKARFFLAALFCLFVLAAGGCMVGPTYHPPEPAAVPAGWAGVTNTPAGRPSVVTPQTAELARWWRQFNDPVLTGLVEEALKANLTIQMAEASLRQARALRGIAVGGLWPSVGSSASYQRGHTAGVPGDHDLFQSGLDALWEMDFFGQQRRQVESASANVQASIEGIRNAQVSLIAEVALDYIQLRGYQQQVLVAQDNLKAQQHTLQIIHAQFNVGFANALDVADAESNVATTAAQIPVYDTDAQQSIYALSILLARPPAELLDRLSPPGKLPGAPAQIPAGLPSDLLRRRPDIHEAEAQLHAATAQIGVAVAELFPSFSLTGNVTWSSNMLGTWWSHSSRSFAAGPSVNWPVFQGGAGISNVHVQEALRDQAFITYQATVLGAFQDVENALIAFSKEQQHREELNKAVIANQKAVDLSLQLYTAGQVEFLNVVEAQLALYSSESALVQSETNIAADLIALYKALGGGWETLPQ